MHISSSKDAKILLEADTDNSNEQDNPRLLFSQDGGAVGAFIGIEGNSGNTALNTKSNAMILGPTTPTESLQFITNGQAQITLSSGVGLVGIHTNTPKSDIDIVQSSDGIAGQAGGVTFTESDDPNDHWRIYNSGTNFSFNRNDVRVAYIAPSGAYTVTSDRRLKKDIEELNSVLKKVIKLKPVKYLYNHQSDNDKPTIGFIAQEVKELFPELVDESEELMGMSYANTGVIAVKAIQEQQVIIDLQSKEIEQLKNQMTIMMKQIINLKK